MLDTQPRKAIARWAWRRLLPEGYEWAWEAALLPLLLLSGPRVFCGVHESIQVIQDNND